MRSDNSPGERTPLFRSVPDQPRTTTAESSADGSHGSHSRPAQLLSGMHHSGGMSAGRQTINSAREERYVRKNLNLRFDHFEYFVYSQCLPAWLLLLLRLAMGCVCVAVFLYMSIMSPFVNFTPSNSTTDDNDTSSQHPPTFKRHFYLCYLTIWSYLIITIYFITTLVNTISMLVCGAPSSAEDFSLGAGGFKSTDNLLQRGGDSSGDIPTSAGPDLLRRQFGLRLQWLLCGVAANAALIVTIGYFGVLYPMIQAARPGPVNGLDLLVHGFNTVFMFVEVAFSGVPVRLVHALYTALYGTIYLLFSLLYWIPDHTNVIYPVLLDWNNVGLTLGMMCLALFVGLPIIQLVWWLVYLARCYLANALLSRSADWEPGLRV